MSLDNRYSAFKFLPFVVLIFACLGCQIFQTVESTQIPQSEIKQTYTVSATRGHTYVSAFFTYGWSKSVDLDAPSKIEHNGAELPQNSMTFIRGTVYEANFEGLQTVHEFVYTNNDRQVFRNAMTFEPLDLPAGEITVSRAQKTKIVLSRAVGKDETFLISLESSKARPSGGSANAPDDDAPKYDLYLSGELDETRAAIVLKPKDLKNFVTGRAVLKVSVSRSFPLAQTNEAGGTMTWNYQSEMPATVVD